jgi:hypothetical protein
MFVCVYGGNVKLGMKGLDRASKLAPLNSAVLEKLSVSASQEITAFCGI